METLFHMLAGKKWNVLFLHSFCIRNIRVSPFGRNCLQQVWKTKLSPKPLIALGWVKIDSMCPCWPLCASTDLSSVTGIYPGATVCPLSSHWNKSRLKKQNLKRNHHSQEGASTCAATRDQEATTESCRHWANGCANYWINCSEWKAPRCLQSPHKAGFWLKGAEE